MVPEQRALLSAPAVSLWLSAERSAPERRRLLNKALTGIETANTSLYDVLEHIDFTRKVGQSKIPDIKLCQLITHFGTYRLRNEDFEFPDLLGAAYEYLIAEFADSAGKKGGEFYTPRSVVRMMVRLIKPTLAHDIYDPCCGSGGMLIAAKEYIDEHGQDGRKANLFGQESGGTVWSIAKMNMLLHGISTADLQNDDTLAEPRHIDNGELRRFDRVLTNPPFSLPWGNTEKTADGTPAWAPKFPERFRFGQVPLGAKKADLMFLQHMLAVTRDGGMIATVMPHGVLFRGGEERAIRICLPMRTMPPAMQPSPELGTYRTWLQNGPETPHRRVRPAPGRQGPDDGGERLWTASPKVPRFGQCRGLAGSGRGPGAASVAATGLDAVWSDDFAHQDGRRACPEDADQCVYPGECLAIEVGASLRPQDLTLTLSRLMRLYGKPAFGAVPGYGPGPEEKRHRHRMPRIPRRRPWLPPCRTTRRLPYRPRLISTPASCGWRGGKLQAFRRRIEPIQIDPSHLRRAARANCINLIEGSAACIVDQASMH